MDPGELFAGSGWRRGKPKFGPMMERPRKRLGLRENGRRNPPGRIRPERL
jgi:hypothetical protein